MIEILVGIGLFVLVFLFYKLDMWNRKDAIDNTGADIGLRIKIYGLMLIFIILGVLLVFGVVKFN